MNAMMDGASMPSERVLHLGTTYITLACVRDDAASGTRRISPVGGAGGGGGGGGLYASIAL